MTATPSLRGPLAKVQRAWTHLDGLYAELVAFLDPQPYAVIDKFDPKTLTYEAWFKVLREPDEIAWGVVLGDYLHNLRSALDHLVGQLVLLSGRTEIGGGSQFPIAVSGSEYWSIGKDGKPSLRDRFLNGVTEEYRATIDRVQPYRAGNDAKRDALAMLNSLSNVDKHRFLHPSWAVFGNVGREHFDVDTGDAEWVALDLDIEGGVLRDGAKILTLTVQTSDPKADVKVNANLPLDIGFGVRRGGRGGIRGLDLKVIGERVEAVIRAYADVLPLD